MVFPALDSITTNYVLDASVNGVVSQILAPGNSLPSGTSCDSTYHAVGCATTVSPAGAGGVNGTASCLTRRADRIGTMRGYTSQAYLVLPLSLVLVNLTHGVTLANRNGATVYFAPEGSSYIDLYLPANNELAGVRVRKLHWNSAIRPTQEFSFQSEVAGPGAR